MAIKPSIPKGTRDFTPEQVARRNYILNTIRTAFEKYGYQPIETPTMENLSTLTGKYGEEGDQLLFKVLNSGNFLEGVSPDKLKSDNAKQLTPEISEKGLRYDLTVPFARYVVMHQNEIIFPFKRYQIQPVFRADRPQRSRYREFFQCDADVVGSTSLLNEVELIQIYDEVFTKLKIPVTIKINSRKVLEGIANMIGATDKFQSMTTSLDKLEKIGMEGVRNEMLLLGIPEENLYHISRIREIAQRGKNTETDFATSQKGKLNSVFGTESIEKYGIKELLQIFSIFDLVPLKSAKLEFDPTLARGLNYYTGAILEVKANGVQIGSIGGGGRYDDLTGVFGLPNVAGVGISFGADRMYDVLEELKLFPEAITTTSKVLFVNFDEKSVEYILPLLQQIRAKGIAAELYPSDDKMKKQLSYANDKKIPFVILTGENEIKEGKLTLKNMVSGEQEKLTIEKIIAKLKN
jgi:histidyl-tRNA synthetase